MILLMAFMADSAPQEAATAALACGVAVIPYVLARSYSQISEPRNKQNID